MSVSVTMPALGESVTEGTVTRWLKAVGDTITADEPLLEVSTDKVDTEIPAPASGVLLSIAVGEDEKVRLYGVPGLSNVEVVQHALDRIDANMVIAPGADAAQSVAGLRIALAELRVVTAPAARAPRRRPRSA